MIDPKNAVSNPNLIAAIQKLKEENNPVNLNVVLNEMVRGKYLVPARIEVGQMAPKTLANGKIPLPQNSKINFMLLSTTDKKKYFLCFTDLAEFRNWNKDPKQQCVILGFDELAKIVDENSDGSGLVINPNGTTVRFEKGLISSVRKQKAEMSKPRLEKRANPIQPGDKVTLVEPTIYPDAMLDPICEVLKGSDAVAAAYLQVMIVNESKKSYLLVLDGVKDDALFGAIAQAAKPFLAISDKKMDLNMTVSISPLGQQAMRGSEPFYLKGKGRIYDEDDD